MVKKTDQKPKTSGKADKPSQSMRDLAKSGKKPSRIRLLGSKSQRKEKRANSKAGKFAGKAGRIFPKFLRNAWAEIRQVTWPGRRETIRLSFAVFVFAAIFSVIVAGLDLGLDKLFREFIIKV